MSKAVVDASLLAAAWIASQHRPEAERLLASGRDLFAPGLVRMEFHNLVHRLNRRQLLTTGEADTRLSRLEALAISIVEEPSWLSRATLTARRYNQPHIYDAIYLACAEDLDVDLWTCDARFVRSFGADRPARLKLCPDDVPVS